METVYKKFYRNFYIRTNGFIPVLPLQYEVYPGDFFQIKNGEMLPLGNIFRKGLVAREDCDFDHRPLSPANWNINVGVTKPYSGRESGHDVVDGDFQFSKQIIAFHDKGSFLFKGNRPESVKIKNWYDLKDELIIKLTQTCYSFRELYVVTESATAADWTLAISSSGKGELEIATEAENFGLVDLFGHSKTKNIQTKDIEFYHRECKRKSIFFKAKKLVVQPEKLDIFVSDLITQRENKNEWAGNFFDYDFQFDPVSHHTSLPRSVQTSVLDMLQTNDLNPNTALLYFRWDDANMDDVEKFFLTYGSL